MFQPRDDADVPRQQKPEAHRQTPFPWRRHLQTQDRKEPYFLFQSRRMVDTMTESVATKAKKLDKCPLLKPCYLRTPNARRRMSNFIAGLACDRNFLIHSPHRFPPKSRTCHK